jgi:putative hemolysin
VTEVFILFFLFLLNAFFSLSEMAIVSASKPLLRQYAKDGSKSAGVALGLAENPGKFLSTVQVGITLVGIIAGAYGGAAFSAKLAEFLNQIPGIYPNGEPIAVALVVAAITYFSVVIGELVPKQIALNKAESLAMFVARPMALLAKLCSPIVAVLEVSAKILLTVLRIDSKDEGVTETEIKAMIAEGAATGALEEEEHDVIQRVIRLGDRDVKSIMTHRCEVDFIDVDDTLAEIQKKIGEAGHSRYPVIDKDTTRVLGIVETKEILAGVGRAEEFHVENYIGDILFLTESTTCLDALDIFKTSNLHLAAVIDEYGAFEGLFTISDLMEAMVGTILSNYGTDEGPMIVERNDHSWLVDGLTPIEEIHITVGIEEIAEEGDFETIAGFVLNHIKGELTVGESFDFAGYRFEVVDMDDHRIDKILIEKIPQGDGGA